MVREVYSPALGVHVTLISHLNITHILSWEQHSQSFSVRHESLSRLSSSSSPPSAQSARESLSSLSAAEYQPQSDFTEELVSHNRHSSNNCGYILYCNCLHISSGSQVTKSEIWLEVINVLFFMIEKGGIQEDLFWIIQKINLKV